MRARQSKGRHRRAAQKSSIVERFAAAGWPLLALVTLAFVLGGGGSRYGVLNLVVQLVALGLMVWFAEDLLHNWRSRPRSLKALVVATMVLPLFQLVPLPPSIWQHLNGGDMAFASRALIGAENGWFPLSLDRPRTAMAAASLIAPITVLLLSSPKIGVAQAFFRLVVLLGLINFVVGGLQVLSGENAFLPYPILDDGRLYGLFASHNTSGVFFVTALCALYGLRFEGADKLKTNIVVAAIALLFVLGTVLTQSRSSIALLLVPCAAFALRWLATYRRHDAKIRPIYIAGVVLALAIGTTFIVTNQRVGETIVRFESLEDQRPMIWEDTLAAIEEFFPYGSGMGSFDEVFQVFESLEHIDPNYARRAHSDYLELGVEAGIFGWLLLCSWAIWLAGSWWRGRKCEESREVDAAALAILSIAAQSTLDYPLRNQALLCLAALLIAMLAARSTRLRDGVSE